MKTKYYGRKESLFPSKNKNYNSIKKNKPFLLSMEYKHLHTIYINTIRYLQNIYY